MIKNGKSVVIIIYVMDEVECCDKVGFIVDGRIFVIDMLINLK